MAADTHGLANLIVKGAKDSGAEGEERAEEEDDGPLDDESVIAQDMMDALRDDNPREFSRLLKGFIRAIGTD
jgi:hypothetical protein